MAKNFDDFAIWERDDPEACERAEQIGKNFSRLLANADGEQAVADAIEGLLDDMITEKLRSYHRWSSL